MNRMSSGTVSEQVLRFGCEGDDLIGILHAAGGDTGVLVVVGGPQYRVGSHRQFVLLARHLAATGAPVLRFDYRGMGDSSGEARNFEAVQADIGAAIDALFDAQPQLRRVVLWGLCDAASAAVFYAAGDARVAGLVLLNPWVREAQGEARTYLKHYYLKRLLSKDFWRKLLGGGVRIGDSLKSLGRTVQQARGGSAPHGNQSASPLNSPSPHTTSSRNAAIRSGRLPDRVRDGLRAFAGPVLLIQSGDDLTAREFDEAVRADPAFARLMAEARITRVDIADANHTFARAVWRDEVASQTARFVGTLGV